MHMDEFYVQLQKQLFPVLLSIYGAEPHINHGLQLLQPDVARSPILNLDHGLQYRGNRHPVKHSCRSDTSDRVAGYIQYIPPSAYTAVNACP
eukprot:1794992-Pleurochrysis_carterae.AAC.1